MNAIQLPSKLKDLNTIAYNCWWSWNEDAQDLFRELNDQSWQKFRNPVAVLNDTEQAVFAKMAKDAAYVKRVNEVYKRMKSYLDQKETWYAQNFPAEIDKPLVYFSTEYAIHESMATYSGGLGVLSGDHVKSASDLGLPMSFVGLFYRKGYFVQEINEQGQQVDVYIDNVPERLPVKPVQKNGEDVVVEVDFPGRKLFAKAWQMEVGRATMYLLDTDIDQNEGLDRELTHRLYGGDREMRIGQEVVLGIGGVRLLDQLGIKPQMWHMNEGHSCFFQLERIKMLQKEHKLTTEEAINLAASNCVFTTHTPVPAGNEAFSLPLMDKYFREYAKEYDISWGEFIEMGLVREGSDNSNFSLTVLALKTARFANGVSKLHGRVSSQMWKDLWPEVPTFENPIEYITNGVHVQSWTSSIMKGLYAGEMGENWEQELSNNEFWQKAHEIDNEKFHETRLRQKREMINFSRTQLKEQFRRHNVSEEEIAKVDSYLHEDALTVGFARRFATYKRATLLFQDLERLNRIVNDPQRPVQFVFAGKAHPQDQGGQDLIKEIFRISNLPEFKGKIIFLENYDMNISRHLISGVDVWLNNPRRPLEASGTSGQKVPLNGGINFSVLDGWWAEGHNGDNGWSIGYERDYETHGEQDEDDSDSLYQVLKELIVPLYYQDGPKGPSNSWMDKAKHSLVTNIARFSTHRMVQDYVNDLYVPALQYGEKFVANNLSHIGEYTKHHNFLNDHWGYITFDSFHLEGGDIHQSYSNYTNDYDFQNVDHLLDDLLPGRVWKCSRINANINLYVGDINPEWLSCELVVTKKGEDVVETFPLGLTHSGEHGIVTFSGNYDFNDLRRVRVRVLPKEDNFSSKFELGLVHWL